MTKLFQIYNNIQVYHNFEDLCVGYILHLKIIRFHPETLFRLKNILEIQGDNLKTTHVRIISFGIILLYDIKDLSMYLNGVDTGIS